MSTPDKAISVEQKGALESQKLIAFVATRDSNRAKAFYRDILGLKLVSEDRFALVFDGGGTMLRVTTVQELTPPQYTVLGWQVPNVLGVAKNLQTKGIHFERYPGMQQDEVGVWNSPNGASVAWFKDPDGNTLSITQF